MSDCSSDVCSSDLPLHELPVFGAFLFVQLRLLDVRFQLLKLRLASVLGMGRGRQERHRQRQAQPGTSDSGPGAPGVLWDPSLPATVPALPGFRRALLSSPGPARGPRTTPEIAN